MAEWRIVRFGHADKTAREGFERQVRQGSDDGIDEWPLQDGSFGGDSAAEIGAEEGDDQSADDAAATDRWL